MPQPGQRRWKQIGRAGLEHLRLGCLLPGVLQTAPGLRGHREDGDMLSSVGGASGVIGPPECFNTPWPRWWFAWLSSQLRMMENILQLCLSGRRMQQPCKTTPGRKTQQLLDKGHPPKPEAWRPPIQAGGMGWPVLLPETPTQDRHHPTGLILISFGPTSIASSMNRSWAVLCVD